MKRTGILIGIAVLLGALGLAALVAPVAHWDGHFGLLQRFRKGEGHVA